MLAQVVIGVQVRQKDMSAFLRISLHRLPGVRPLGCKANLGNYTRITVDPISITYNLVITINEKM